jgi:Ferritin-like domain/TAT (twin-arginine translocation) pathway signal sequence
MPSDPASLFGPLTRRRFLQIGGAVTLGAALTACIGDGGNEQSQDNTGGAEGRRVDITIVRTLSSLEALAVVVYETGLGSGLLTTPAVADLANVFQSHHREHGALFQGVTRDLRGTPFTQPNPAVLQQLQPEIDALRDEAGVVALARDTEAILAETYEATVGAFGDKSFNVAAMSVGGAEARHFTALAQVLGQPPVPSAFQGSGRAVPAGTGV